MISERDAAWALPSRGWLREYVEHAYQQTTAPLGYHIGVGLSVLAVTCPLNFGSRYAGSLRGNLYSLLVGRSGEDQKSTALDVGRRVLFAAAPTLIGDHPGSWEGLIDSLSRRPSQIIVYSEFGKFLSAAQKGYFEPLKATMTDLWDCLDTETEILTEGGWRGVGEVEVGERVWSLNRATDRLELTPALDVGVRPVRKGEQMLVLRGQRANIRTTEGHDFYVRHRGRWESLKGRDLASRRLPYSLPLAAPAATPFPGLDVTDDELRFIAWFLTDGGFSGRTKVQISQSKPAMVDHIRALLTRLGFDFTERVRTSPTAFPNAKPLHLFVIPRGLRGKRGWDSLAPYLDKDVVPSLHAMTEAQFRIFWSELLKGDGESLDSPSGGLLWCDRAQQADAYTMMATLRGMAAGYSTRLTAKGHLMFRVSVRDARSVTSDPQHPKAMKPRLEPAAPDEQVWCVTNANGTLVTRRQGRIAILGNCTPQHRVKANGVATRVDDPRLSIMAGCSVPYLERHTEPHDWSGGFMGRWLVLYSRRERTDPDPMGNDIAVPGLAAALTARASITAAGDYGGLDASAKTMWDDWFYDLERRPVPDIIAGAKTRAPTIARKVAMLLSWDYGQAVTGAPWQITVNELEPAIKVAELHLKSVIGLSEKLAEHPDAQVRRQVLESVALGGVATLGQILRTTKLRRRTVTEILDALVLDGSLTKSSLVGGDALYERPTR
jgi:hypothetical protein